MSQKSQASNDGAAAVLAFYVSLAIILLESLALITSPLWDSVVVGQAWIADILKHKSQLLSVAAAITILFALIMTFKPRDPAKYVAIGGGILSFSAAAASFDITRLTTGAALIFFTLPLYLIIFPSLRFPKERMEWMGCIAVTIFFSLASLTTILSIPPLQKEIVDRGIYELADVVVISILIGVLLTAISIIINLSVQAINDWWKEHPNNWLYKAMQPIRSYLERRTKNRRGTRAERRRANQKA